MIKEKELKLRSNPRSHMQQNMCIQNSILPYQRKSQIFLGIKINKEMLFYILVTALYSIISSLYKNARITSNIISSTFVPAYVMKLTEWICDNCSLLMKKKIAILSLWEFRFNHGIFNSWTRIMDSLIG